MSKFLAILYDIVVVVKLVFYLIYCYAYNLIRNLLPSHKTCKNVQGQVVLITGAAGGIGSNLVVRFFDHGCSLLCVDNDKTNLDRLKSDLYKRYSNDFSNEILSKRLKFYVVDIRSVNDIKDFASNVKSEFNKVDILINNAAIMNDGKYFLELEEKDVRNIFDVNILSHFWLCKEFLGDMVKDNRGGHIVNVSSACGQMGAYKLTDYCATKFAVTGFTESLRIELKIKHPKANVKCTTVCPFHVKTKLFDGVTFSRLSWLNLSMDTNSVGETIFNGILMEKEIIFMPHVTLSIFCILKQLVTTKFFDHALQELDLDGAMNSYKKKIS